jgi:hypothetical protein
MTVRGADYPRRKNDDYPTPAEVLDVLFKHVRFRGPILDPACGKLARVVKAAERHGYSAGGDDIIYGHNFLNSTDGTHDIVTNPPFGDRRGSLTLAFIEHALKLTAPDMRKVAMLLPVDFDSGKTRVHVFNHPAFSLKLVLLDRVKWFNGKSGSLNHAWFIWDWGRNINQKTARTPGIKYARTPDGKQVKKQGRADRAPGAARAARRRPAV